MDVFPSGFDGGSTEPVVGGPQRHNEDLRYGSPMSGCDKDNPQSVDTMSCELTCADSCMEDRLGSVRNRERYMLGGASGPPGTTTTFSWMPRG
jgi:hypothetical protein